MELPDPNAPQDPTPPAPEPPAPEPAPAPSLDIDAAYDLIAQAEGFDPRVARFEFSELRRKKEQLERERRDWEEERRRYRPEPAPQLPEFMDPGQRMLFQLLHEDREERRREREERENERRQAAYANEAVDRLSYSYETEMRNAGFTPQQIQESRERFFLGAMQQLYPEGRLPAGMDIERAVRNAVQFYKATGRNGNGSAPQPQVYGRGPTATRTIPGSPQPFTPTGNPLPPSDDLSPAPLQGESLEQYEARLRRIIESAGVRGLPDGARVSSA